MSYFDSFSEIKFDNNLLANMNIPNFFGNVVSAFQKMFSSISYAIQNFTKLEGDIRMASVFSKVKENWLFEIDTVTGVSVLKIDHEKTAIAKTRNMLHGLFE